LLAHGHPEAWCYPLGLLWVEAALVVERENTAHATNAMLLKMVFDATPNMNVKTSFTAKSAKAFAKTMKAMIGEK
jgi:hypothetical protein